jgi:hypothetical protein
MAPEDICKYVLITKFGLFNWIVMPFGMKNRFLKMFMDDLNVHNLNWEEHLGISTMFY